METSPDFQQLWVARGRTTKPTLVPPQFHTDYIKKGVLFLLESGVGEFREGNAPHSSTLAWKIPWTEEAGRLQSMGSRRVGHDLATSLSLIGEGNGNPLQYSCLENPMDGGGW